MGKSSRKRYPEHGPFSGQWDWGKMVTGTANGMVKGFGAVGPRPGKPQGKDSLKWNVGWK